MSETQDDTTEFKREPEGYTELHGEVKTVNKAYWFKATTEDGSLVFYNDVLPNCRIKYDGPLMEVRP